MSGGRRVVVWTLVVLATLIAFVSTLTMWLDRQLLDNTAWNNASRQVVENAQVREALSVYLVNQLYANVDVAAALRQRLPDQAKPLAAPAAAALRQPAQSTVSFMLARPRVQQLWLDASGRAHARLVNVLENKTGYGISTGNGVVTLQLDELVKQLGTEVGISQQTLAKIPASSGEIVLMRSNQLSLAQQSVHAIRVLSVWLLVAVLAMYALAVYLARGSRRSTLRTVAWAFVLVGVLDLVVRKIVGNYVVDALASPTYRGTGHEVWLIATSMLGQIGGASILYGAIGVAGTALAGPTSLAVGARRRLAPVFERHLGFAWGAAGFVFLLLVLWGGTHALRTWWGVLLIGALLAAGLLALQRQVLSEAATVRPAPLRPAHNGGGVVDESWRLRAG